MIQLANKHILLGITGSIAAYKGAELVRLLRGAGAEVRVVMSKGAMEFITPMTLQALSGHPVHSELLDLEAEQAMGHIELARWADAIVVAPASADFLARLAQGRADDLLSAVCLARHGILAVSPAMNQHMWGNAATQQNLQRLQEQGVQQFGPASGEQACGDVGLGRLLESIEILQLTANLFQTGLLSGKRVLITAGPTQEAIDPVRYISNRSSGKMGYALAEAVIETGAHCTLISGPVAISAPDRAHIINVRSAQDMHAAVMQHIKEADIFIASAAVADYRPAEKQAGKMKKTSDRMQLELLRNPDILAEVASQYPQVFSLGFAAETDDLANNAKAKLSTKKLNMIAANQVNDQGLGFDSDDNAVHVFWQGGEQQLAQMRKTELARQLVSLLAERFRR